MTIPFADSDVEAAFAEYAVVFPPLGEGSFKVAYLATRSDGTSTVVKILTNHVIADPDDSSKVTIPARVERELEGMATISSPHVATIVSGPEVKRIGTEQYLCYEEPYYSGGTLEERIAQRTFDEAEVRALIFALLSAVEALWEEQQIVHRDIKPGNIVWDNFGQPVLLDLGIALYSTLSDLTESHLTSPKTPRYAAPEQFELRRFAQLDARTDMFLIGIVAVEALTGKHPFWEEGIDTGLYFDRLENFDGSFLLEAGHSPDLVRVISRFLASRPNRRYRSAQAALEDLAVEA